MYVNENRAILVTDLGYGDAGKGSVVDYLTRTTGAHTVIRFNGGAQAAHNVVTRDGRHHTFAQFGSGTFVPGTRTHLSRFMLFNPLALLAEERHLRTVGVKDGLSRLSIDREALVTTPFQSAANRLKELARGDGRHGSCGMGIGETMSDWLEYGGDVLFAGDLLDRNRMLRKLQFIRDAKLAQLEPILANLRARNVGLEELQILQDAESIPTTADVYGHFADLVAIVPPEHLGLVLDQPGTVIFEGAQGVLLDEWYGFYPYNSWSTLTNRNAEVLLSENGFDGETLRLGLLRAYATRHGAGPFVTEDVTLSEQMQDDHNMNNPWQREFRVGYLDLLTLRYALSVTGPLDGLVLTNLDRMREMADWLVCGRYQYVGSSASLPEFFSTQEDRVYDYKIPADVTDLEKHRERTDLLLSMRPDYTGIERDESALIDLVSDITGVPVVLTSTGPTADDKKNMLQAASTPPFSLAGNFLIRT